MIGTYNYIFFSNDIEFLSDNWAKYTSAMNFALNQIDSTGLFYGNSATNDWGRIAADGTLTSLQVSVVGFFFLYCIYARAREPMLP
jgi:hypothetical protein